MRSLCLILIVGLIFPFCACAMPGTFEVTFNAPGQSGLWLHEEQWFGFHELLPFTWDFPARTVDYGLEVWDNEDPNDPDATLLLTLALRVWEDRTLVCLNVNGHGEYCDRTTVPGVTVNNVTKTVSIYAVARCRR